MFEAKYCCRLSLAAARKRTRFWRLCEMLGPFALLCTFRWRQECGAVVCQSGFYFCLRALPCLLSSRADLLSSLSRSIETCCGHGRYHPIEAPPPFQEFFYAESCRLAQHGRVMHRGIQFSVPLLCPRCQSLGHRTHGLGGLKAVPSAGEHDYLASLINSVPGVLVLLVYTTIQVQLN